MANSLEVGCRYLDKEMVEISVSGAGSDEGWKRPDKSDVEENRGAVYSRECVYRPKEGFSYPIKNWLLGSYGLTEEDLLAPDYDSAGRIVRPGRSRALKRKPSKEWPNNSHVLWSTLVFRRGDKLWLDHCVPDCLGSGARCKNELLLN